uniref:Putative exodeoxyribonuclease V, beta subunit recB n=1 Tax=mine drainage metagenome TaxID=410659 RepID=E6QV11_9ZZZZ
MGSRDADYTQKAFEDAFLSHRYDVQSTLYQLALHRLLRHRLGSRYDPEQHLGGTIFLFLRGIQGPERGCLSMPAQWDLLRTLDTALQEETPL